MSKKEMVLGLALSYDDMCSIGAACGVMSIQMLKEADCAKDLQEAASEIKAQKEHDSEEN